MILVYLFVPFHSIASPNSSASNSNVNVRIGVTSAYAVAKHRRHVSAKEFDKKAVVYYDDRVKYARMCAEKRYQN